MANVSRYLAAPRLGGWSVTLQGERKATSMHASAESAWADARRRARGAGGEAQLHDHNGSIRVSNSYKTQRSGS